MADLVRNGEGKCDQAQGPVWKRFEEKYAKAPAEATEGEIGQWAKQGKRKGKTNRDKEADSMLADRKFDSEASLRYLMS